MKQELRHAITMYLSRIGTKGGKAGSREDKQRAWKASREAIAAKKLLVSRALENDTCDKGPSSC